jgi:hypothetical protein
MDSEHVRSIYLLEAGDASRVNLVLVHQPVHPPIHHPNAA